MLFFNLLPQREINCPFLVGCTWPVSSSQVAPVEMHYLWVGTMLHLAQTCLFSHQHMPEPVLSTDSPFSPFLSCPPLVSTSSLAPVSVWVEHPQHKHTSDADSGWNQFCCNVNLLECIMYLWRDRRNIYQLHYRLNEPAFRGGIANISVLEMPQSKARALQRNFHVIKPFSFQAPLNITTILLAAFPSS